MHDPNRAGIQQQAGKWTTPDGPNRRYTIRLHVVGERVGELGGVRPHATRHVDLRVITPLGEHTAAVVAANVLRHRKPRLVFRQVELVSTEDDFVTDGYEIWDDAATAR